jgi:hypothetical protein
MALTWVARLSAWGPLDLLKMLYLNVTLTALRTLTALGSVAVLGMPRLKTALTALGTLTLLLTRVLSSPPIRANIADGCTSESKIQPAPRISVTLPLHA